MELILSLLSAATGWIALPLLVVLSSFIPGVGIMFLREDQHGLRTALNLAGAVLKVVLVGLMLWGVSLGTQYEWSLEVLPGFELTLVGDSLALLFVTLSAGLWLVTTVYAVGYLEGSPNRTRFFSFFSLCVTATTGLAMAGDLFTFVLFYEALTWTTYPLIVHRGTPEALRAGRTYLAYTLTAGAFLLVGAVGLNALAGSVEFRSGGLLDAELVAGAPGAYTLVFLLLLAGVGVKVAFFPLHGWLPAAMVAPAPVSALLHAVAVVKAGAFGLVRLLHSVFGIELATDLGLAPLVAGLAAVTIVYGSIRALHQDDLKRRLAFSTVSQLSYIALGAALLAPTAHIGGIVHLVHQGIMKITLFFCAGLLAETLHIKNVSEMGGVGRRMPLTMLAFSVAALGMIGLPPMAGFASKWYLGIGALESGAGWAVPVLLVSSMLNAAYFLPILGTAWFHDQNAPWRDVGGSRRLEADWKLLVPALVTAALTLGAGIFAGSPWSPLGWTRLIVEQGVL
ncbi:MAG: proton-conducting transporter membrane subunit [Gemmatimonadota bacterium]